MIKSITHCPFMCLLLWRLKWSMVAKPVCSSITSSSLWLKNFKLTHKILASSHTKHVVPWSTTDYGFLFHLTGCPNDYTSRWRKDSQSLPYFLPFFLPLSLSCSALSFVFSLSPLLSLLQPLYSSLILPSSLYPLSSAPNFPSPPLPPSTIIPVIYEDLPTWNHERFSSWQLHLVRNLSCQCFN